LNLPYPLFIALRYLRTKKKHRGISINILISIGGVAVGVMALLVVLSVMSGFHEDLQKKILGVNAHMIILDYKGTMPEYKDVIQKLEGEENIISHAPFVLGQAMVSYGKKAHGVFLRGIIPEKEIKTTEILKYMKEGKLENLASRDEIPVLYSERSLQGA